VARLEGTPGGAHASARSPRCRDALRDLGRGQLAAALAGQLYVDAVFDAAVRQTPDALGAGVLGAARKALADARDYDELRAMLPTILATTDDTAMQELILGTVMNCVAAGVFSATPEAA